MLNKFPAKKIVFFIIFQVIFLLTLFLIIYIFTPSFFKKYFTQSDFNVEYNSFQIASNNVQDDYELIFDIISRVKKDYIFEKTDNEISELTASSLLNSLDPHSTYLTPESLNNLRVNTKGQFGGLGIEVTSEDNFIKIVTVLEDTPASEAGLKSGDYITRVGEKSLYKLSISEAVAKLRGKVGDVAKIAVARDGENQILYFNIKRDIIKIDSVKEKIIEGILIIKINNFSEHSYKDVIKAIKNYEDKKGIIIDMRNNPGGLLDQAVQISDIFLDKNKDIVKIKSRDNKKIYKDKSNQKLTKNLPIIVLINAGSASASEIVAGALKDNKRAIIMGEKSFGKGSVQTVTPLENGGAVKMTTALYYTPNDISIQAEGIIPDIILASTALAKIEKIDNKYKSSESELSNHIKNLFTEEKIFSDDSKSSSDIVIEDDNLDLYNEDYQLARALDLLRGLSLIQNNFYDK